MSASRAHRLSRSRSRLVAASAALTLAAALAPLTVATSQAHELTAPAGSAPQTQSRTTHTAGAKAGRPTKQLPAQRTQVRGDGSFKVRHRAAVIRPKGTATLPPAVQARAWIVADLDRGVVLARKKSGERLPVASIQKLLTAVTAVETIPETRSVAVPSWAAGQICSCAGIKSGVHYPRKSLLAGAMLPSGNDAAESLAATHPEGRWVFYNAMNATAQRLGATRTVAKNASGLTVSGQHSTARDMLIILNAAMAHPDIAELAATRTSAPVTTRAGSTHWVPQKTHYVASYPGAAGKSGYTSAALNTLAVHTVVGGQRLGVVTLGAPGGHSTSGTRALAEWAASQRKALRKIGSLPAPGATVNR